MARIQVSNDSSGRMIVSFAYDPLLIATAKTIPGHKWHPVEKYWSFPNTDGTLERILEAFQENENRDSAYLKELPASADTMAHKYLQALRASSMEGGLFIIFLHRSITKGIF